MKKREMAFTAFACVSLVISLSFTAYYRPLTEWQRHESTTIAHVACSISVADEMANETHSMNKNKSQRWIELTSNNIRSLKARGSVRTSMMTFLLMQYRCYCPLFLLLLSVSDTHTYLCLMKMFSIDSTTDLWRDSCIFTWNLWIENKVKKKEEKRIHIKSKTKWSRSSNDRRMCTEWTHLCVTNENDERKERK